MTFERLVAGGAAGALSRVTTAPIDRVKLLFQVNATAAQRFTPSSAMSVTSRIVREEGALALWRGTGAAVTRILPYSATTFAVFPAYNDALARAVGEPEGGTVATRFVAGALAGTTATILTYPLDLLHARVSAHTPIPSGAAGGIHMGPAWDAAPAPASPAAARSAAASLSKTPPAPMGLAGAVRHLQSTVASGGVRQLYAGLGPTLMGIVPYGGISFATFESIKSLYRARGVVPHDWEGDEMPVAHKLAAGGVSGFIAQTVTYPLHIVRRRMQVRGSGAYPSVSAGLAQIYRTEGVWNGLFKGVGLTWVKGPLAAAIGFTANDVLKATVPAGREAASAWAASPPAPTPATYIEAKQTTAVESLVAGGVAGAVAKTVIAPADRVKIIYQVDAKRAFTLTNAARTARDIVAAEGAAGLWRGNGVMMARVVPYAGVSFLAYPRYEAAARRIAERAFGEEVGEAKDGGGGRRIAVRFLAGSAAGATATALTYPLDLMRARYAAAGVAGAISGTSTSTSASSTAFASRTGAGSFGAWRVIRDVASVARSEGARGLYGGMTPTLLGIVPYAGISFATFETLKSRYNAARRAEAEARGEPFDPDAAAKDMPVVARLCFGGVAGLFAQSLTYPLDIVRRRVQVMGRAGGYASPWRALVDIARAEGLVGGLYKGVTMNWIKGPVSVAVSFYVNDAVKAKFREAHERAAAADH